AETARQASGGVDNPRARSAIHALSKDRVVLVATPHDIASALPGPARDIAVRSHLTEDAAQPLDAVVFLTRIDGQPGARVWTAKASDRTIEGFVADALRTANRRQVFEQAGI